MKKYLIILLAPLKLISMGHSDIVYTDEIFNPDLPKPGWPHKHKSRENMKENLAALVESRIKNKQNLNAPITYYYSFVGNPLFESCRSDDTLAITKKLLAHGANPNEQV